MSEIRAIPPEEKLAHVTVVLKDPTFAGNVGATARAMKNMGLTDLRLVNPPRDRNGDAVAFASSAGDLLKSATLYHTLEEAVADCHWVVGTTARSGGWRKSLQTPRDLCPQIAAMVVPNRVAVVFGSEDRGLTNDDILRCTHLMRIPTSNLMSSLNLSQAVMVASYEMFQAVHSEHWRNRRLPRLANREEIDGMLEHLTQALDAVGYFPAGNQSYFMMDLNHLFNRARLMTSDIAALRGIARQILWAVNRGAEFRFRRWLDELETGVRRPEEPDLDDVENNADLAPKP